MDLPKNWPQNITYLATPSLDRNLTPEQLQVLRTKPPDESDKNDVTVPTIPTLPRRPNALVRITPITDPSHPACGQFGLFATQRLRPGTFVTLYLGRVHNGNATGAADSEGGGDGSEELESDYDLWIDHAAGIAVDGAREGNEGRFINDYRGVPETTPRQEASVGRAKAKPEHTGKGKATQRKGGEGEGRAGKVSLGFKGGPNAEFREVWSAGFGMRCMAVYTLPERRKGKMKSKTGGYGGGGAGGGSEGVAKGEEILVSYGKGFWAERAGHDHDHDHDGNGGGEEDYGHVGKEASTESFDENMQTP